MIRNAFRLALVAPAVVVEPEYRWHPTYVPRYRVEEHVYVPERHHAWYQGDRS